MSCKMQLHNQMSSVKEHHILWNDACC